MKRTLLVFVLAAALTACGGEEGSEPAAAPTSAAPSPTASPSTPASDDRAYLIALANDLRGTPYSAVPEDTLLRLGTTVCGALDRGVSPEEIVSASDPGGVPVRAVYEASAQHLCPKHGTS